MNLKDQASPSSPQPSTAGAPQEIADLRSALEDLRAEMRAIDQRHTQELRQFAYTVSHDLREPVRMIVSYAQLLERRYQDRLDPDAREFVQHIGDAVQRMERFLSDLLTYSNHAGIVEEPPAPVDAELAFQDALVRLDSAVRESGAQITHDALPQVEFNFDRLTQLFRQLISNSIKFRSADPPRIHISASDTEDEVVFAVQDNGIGIEPNYHEQVFGLFKRLHGRQYPGTGLGLPICKRIVEQYGGRIWLESEPGKGSTFRFAVPK